MNDEELMHIEDGNNEIHKMLDALEADDWYFFRSAKSGSYWAKRRTSYGDRVSERWTFADTPEQAIKQAYEIMGNVQAQRREVRASDWRAVLYANWRTKT